MRQTALKYLHSIKSYSLIAREGKHTWKFTLGIQVWHSDPARATPPSLPHPVPPSPAFPTLSHAHKSCSASQWSYLAAGPVADPGCWGGHRPSTSIWQCSKHTLRHLCHTGTEVAIYCCRGALCLSLCQCRALCQFKSNFVLQNRPSVGMWSLGKFYWCDQRMGYVACSDVQLNGYEAKWSFAWPKRSFPSGRENFTTAGG